MQPPLVGIQVSMATLQGRTCLPQPGSFTFTSFDFGHFLDHSAISPTLSLPLVLREWGSEGNGITGEEAGGLSEGEGEAASGAFFSPVDKN